MTQARDLGDAANKANFLDNVSSDIQTQVTANATAASNASTAASNASTAAANAVLPAGLILPFGNASAPTGFLACEGQVVSRSTYWDLFMAIGVTWNTGGETGAQFRIPDLRGAFLRGTGSNATHNMANGSDFAGPSVGSFENDQFQGHKHNLRIFTGTATYGPRAGDNYSQVSSYDTLGATTDSTYGTARIGDETRPFNAGILYCIKT